VALSEHKRTERCCTCVTQMLLSVFHVGRSGDGHFYAMEFVEGETLDNLIKRCG
jgi:hypothetical protein